ncbi:uncharacterized protein LOC133918760 isoform X2 [Phragmites australis]|uniref:uncharacterized protein LOC133918760 isoform X2 n=1 Tax=Phragmites australis TaxID=29695 RepID=UPI002D7777E3|nr:uncharacterized protein LOC133918760 isoform X2 [Phragmites australis]
MDAVELPLPAKVDFGKILTPAAAVEGVDGGVVGGGGGGGGGEVLMRCADADRRHGGDVKQLNQNAESYPSYKSKRTSLEVSMHKSLGLGFKSENNGKRDYLGNDTVLSLHKQDSKIMTKKTIKLLDGPSCSKRPKLEPVQTTRDAEDKGHDFMSQKNVPELMQCTPSGAHGLKSDICDITNHIENLSLSELLSGTYKYSSLGREKGKKVLRTKDELLVSVRKAFSMLSGMDGYCGKDANFMLSPKLPSASISSCEVKEQSGDKPSSLIKDSSQINICDTALCCPKDMLRRLTLPQGQDLDSLLSPVSESSAAVKPHMPSMTVHGASLPPYPWSHSQTGGYRPSVDCGKHGSSRSNSQWQWVRVGSNLTPLDYEDKSVHKIDDLLQEMDAAKLSIMDSCDVPYNLCGTESTSGSLVQNIHSRKNASEHGSQQLQPLDHGDSSDGFQKHDSEHSLLKTSQASPILHAAETLCDMRRSTESWSAQGYSNGAIKWPKSPSEKVMKARKPSSPFGTAESSSGSHNSDATRNGNNHSTKKIVDRKNDSARLNNPGKGPIRWPVPIEDTTYPVRPERGSMLDMRQPHGNGGRHPVQVSSQARLEKEYENQQKMRKATLASSLGSAGDWNRERNRRM